MKQENRYIRHNRVEVLDKKTLLSEYVNFYQNLVEKKGLEVLNTKMPREYVEHILDEIGEVLLKNAKKLSQEDEKITTFLKENPLPPMLKNYLPDDFRVFSLLLNALKQWVSKESAYTDKFLLGGYARKFCKDATTKCLVTGEEIDEDGELHHVMRDGRPPILLSKRGHDKLEHKKEGNPTLDKIKPILQEKHSSWQLLAEGLEFKLGKRADARTNAKSIANKVLQEMQECPGMESSPEALLELISKKLR